MCVSFKHQCLKVKHVSVSCFYSVPYYWSSRCPGSSYFHIDRLLHLIPFTHRQHVSMPSQPVMPRFQCTVFHSENLPISWLRSRLLPVTVLDIYICSASTFSFVLLQKPRLLISGYPYCYRCRCMHRPLLMTTCTGRLSKLCDIFVCAAILYWQ